MILLARTLRALAKLRFRILGLATIKDMSGLEFEALIAALRDGGWRLSSRYRGFDAGIDYNRLKLRKGLRSLTCEWDNWTEWSIEGPRRIIENIAKEHSLTISYAWRWSEYDAPQSGA